MLPHPEDWTVRELVDYFKRGVLLPNPMKSALKTGFVQQDKQWRLSLQKNPHDTEAWFQRAVVWSDVQMRLFIDSVFRGYYMPLIYLRKLPDQDVYEIIDGQQRIHALYGFATGDAVIPEFVVPKSEKVSGLAVIRKPISQLLDPGAKDARKYFQNFQREELCPWAGLNYSELPDAMKKKFQDTNVSVVVMENISDAVTTDIFIRLQGGSALTAQEKRDALPGHFCQCVRQIGGKHPIEWPAHPFFLELVPVQTTDTGKTRQLVAQTFSLFLARRDEELGPVAFSSTDSDDLDACYREHVKMSSLLANDFVRVWDELHSLLMAGNVGKERFNPNVMHLALLADMLLGNDFDPQWKSGIVDAVMEWRENLTAFKSQWKTGRISETPRELHPAMNFDAFEKPSNRDIRERHAIYVREMIALLGDDLKPANAGASPGDSEALREAVYYRDNRQCHHCKKDVEFADAHFQQVQGHAKGKFMEHWALVHKNCAGPPS